MTLSELAESGNVTGIAEFLTSHPLIAEDQLANALAAAAWREDAKIVHLLLARGAKINYQPHLCIPALHCAIEQGNRALVEILCQHGADVNFRDRSGTTPLHRAVDTEADAACQMDQAPSLEIIKVLLELGADPNGETSPGNTSLSIAERYGFSDVIELLKCDRGH